MDKKKSFLNIKSCLLVINSSSVSNISAQTTTIFYDSQLTMQSDNKAYGTDN